MGDRVSVTLSVPIALADAAELLIKKYDGNFSEAQEHTLFVDYEFDEVNYGNLEAEKHLTAAGIAWVKTWGPGSGFNGGTAWAMFREDGSLHRIEMDDESPKDTLALFFKLLDEPVALLEALAIERDKLTTQPWENQVEYGKRYLTTILINPPPPQLKLPI